MFAEVDCIREALEVGIIRKLVVVNSVSKTCALPGLRIGWALCPRDMASVIGQWQFGYYETPSMVGVTPVIVDLWLRMRYFAEKSRRTSHCVTSEELSEIYGSAGLLRSKDERQAFDEMMLSRRTDSLYRQHVSYFESQVNTFRSNWRVFESTLCGYLDGHPQCFKGFNVMVSRSDVDLDSPLEAVRELLRETGISIVPETCFVISRRILAKGKKAFSRVFGTKPECIS